MCTEYTTTRQGQPIGFNLTYGQMPAPLIGVSLSKTKKTTFQIHHIALSANALFRLTLPRTNNDDSDETRILRRRGEDRRLSPRGQVPKFGGVAKRMRARHFPSSVLDREVGLLATRIALPHMK